MVDRLRRMDGRGQSVRKCVGVRNFCTFGIHRLPHGGFGFMASQEPIGSDGHGFHISLPNSAAAASHARKQFIRFIEHFRLSAELVADIEAALGEALANAAEHGYKHRGTIRVEARLTEAYLEATISDDGPGFFLRGPIAVDHPPANSPRGFGLFLIRALVDELEFRDNGKTVWFLKRLGAASE